MVPVLKIRAPIYKYVEINSRAAVQRNTTQERWATATWVPCSQQGTVIYARKPLSSNVMLPFKIVFWGGDECYLCLQLWDPRSGLAIANYFVPRPIREYRGRMIYTSLNFSYLRGCNEQLKGQGHICRARRESLSYNSMRIYQLANIQTYKLTSCCVERKERKNRKRG